MQFVAVWDVVRAIASEIEISEDEVATNLRLAEEVPPVTNPDSPGAFKGRTRGEMREEVISGLAHSFASAYRISHAAALLDNVLLHAGDAAPMLYDFRQTGLPRASASALAELQPVLFGAAKFRERLVNALSAGKLRNFPLHSRPDGSRVEVNDWTSRPTDWEIVGKMAFSAAEISTALRRAEIPFGVLRDLGTGEVVEEVTVGDEMMEGTNSQKQTADVEPGWYRQRKEPFQWQGTPHEKALVEFKEQVVDGKPHSFQDVADEFNMAKSQAATVYYRAIGRPKKPKNKPKTGAWHP